MMMMKNSILSGRHVSIFIGPSSGPLRNRSKGYLSFNAFGIQNGIPQCIEISSLSSFCKTTKGNYQLRHVSLVVCLLVSPSAPTGRIFMKSDFREFYENLSRIFKFL